MVSFSIHRIASDLYHIGSCAVLQRPASVTLPFCLDFLQLFSYPQPADPLTCTLVPHPFRVFCFSFFLRSDRILSGNYPLHRKHVLSFVYIFVEFLVPGDHPPSYLCIGRTSFLRSIVAILCCQPIGNASCLLDCFSSFVVCIIPHIFISVNSFY